MKKKLLALSCLLALYATGNYLDRSGVYQDHPILQKFTGKWMMKTSKGAIVEEWQKTDASTLSGKSYLLKKADTITLETLMLKSTPDNKVVYTSVINNQNEGKAISFEMTGSANDTYTFENPQHDFPKRIHYHFVTADSLHAWIDGGKEMAGKRSDFYFRRVKN